MVVLKFCPLFFQIAPTRNIRRKIILKNHRRPGPGQGEQFLGGRQRQVSAGRHDDDAIIPAGHLDFSISDFRRLQLPVGDVIEGAAAVPKFMRRFADGLIFKPDLLRLHLQCWQPVGGLVPIIINRPVEQHVVVRLARLQNGLAARDVRR